MLTPIDLAKALTAYQENNNWDEFSMRAAAGNFGFIRACLIQFGIIERDKLPLGDVEYRIFWVRKYRKETDDECIIRLAKEYLQKQNASWTK